MMQRTMIVRHEWARGTRIHTDANVAAKHLEELRDEEGRLTLRSVVDANRDERAPLHHEFEWDDTLAADAYRITQAGHIVRSIRRVQVDLRTEEELPPERPYIPVSLVRAPEPTREQTPPSVPPPSATYTLVTLAASEDQQHERMRASLLTRIERLAHEARGLAPCADIAEDLAELIEKYR